MGPSIIDFCLIFWGARLIRNCFKKPLFRVILESHLAVLRVKFDRRLTADEKTRPDV